MKQEHRKEILDIKQRYDLEKMDRKNSTPMEAEDVTNAKDVPAGMVESGAIDMLKLLQEMDDEEIIEDNED